MSGYLIIAENITLKNNKLSCINIFDRISTIAMPSEFVFDLAVICGPQWTVGEHNLTIKAKGSNGKEVSLGNFTVNIPNEDFVYNAYAQDLKLIVDETVKDLTLYVYENEEPIITRKYVISSIFVRQKPEDETQKVEKKDSKKKN